MSSINIERVVLSLVFLGVLLIGYIYFMYDFAVKNFLWIFPVFLYIFIFLVKEMELREKEYRRVLHLD